MRPEPALNRSNSGNEGWTPDLETIQWISGWLDSDDVGDMIRRDLHNRAAQLKPSDDGYWNIVGESAIESVLWPAARRAAEMQASRKEGETA